MSNRFSAYMWLLLLVALSALPAHADWINLSGAMSANNVAEFHVDDDQVRVVFEIYVNDLPTFFDLVPDNMLKAGVLRPDEAKRMARFANETLAIVADEQTVLPAQLVVAEPRMRSERPNPYAGMINPMTRQPVPGPPEDKRVLYVELRYPFETGHRPTGLTLAPPVGKDGYPMASIGFITYHNGLPVIDYAYLSEPAQLTLDWEDPWYSRFKNKQFKRWQQSGVLTYLYVEPFEVRHETLVRVKDLASWMDLGLRGHEYIEADEFAALQQRIGQFLLKHSQVAIDGRSLPPILDRINFVKRTMTRTYFLEQPERMPLNTAMVGVVVTYLTDSIPQQVTVDWQLFSDRIQRVPTVAQDPAGPFPSYVTPRRPGAGLAELLEDLPAADRGQYPGGHQASPTCRLPAASLICLALILPAGFQIRRRKKSGQPVTFTWVVWLRCWSSVPTLVPFGRIAVGRPALLAPRVDSQQAVVIVESLLKNIYRSFDFREESDIYDPPGHQCQRGSAGNHLSAEPKVSDRHPGRRRPGQGQRGGNPGCIGDTHGGQSHRPGLSCPLDGHGHRGPLGSHPQPQESVRGRSGGRAHGRRLENHRTGAVGGKTHRSLWITTQYCRSQA